MSVPALVLSLVGCSPKDPVQIDEPSHQTGDDPVTHVASVEDVAVEAGYQGSDSGHFKRGRSSLVADFDRDGDEDVFVGNPGDESYVLLNESTPGTLRFSLGPRVSAQHMAWGGAVGDLDNDGDIDLFVSGGGNERPAEDKLYRNALAETGTFSLREVTDKAGVAGTVDADGEFHWQNSAGAHMVDFDNDGWLDIFVNTALTPLFKIPTLAERPGLGQNALWHGGSGATFEDVAVAAGLTSTESSQHSMFLDWDGDGDFDLYESNYRTQQHLWRNQLAETGRAVFTEVTQEMTLGGGDLRFPYNAFVSAAADFNFDGWEDLVVFVRAFEEPEESPYHDGHVLLINVEGRGFVDVAPLTGINDPYVNWENDTLRDHSGGGAMGCQIGDLNVDGIPDVFVGQGGPKSGTASILFLSTGLQEVEIDGVGAVTIPVYAHSSELIDYPSDPPADGGIEMPPYPYRTHGTNIIDFDRDGIPELAVHNGGPAKLPDIVQEPARLYRFSLDREPRWLEVELVGSGPVNASAFGTKVTASVRRSSDGATWTLTRWLHGGNGFSANNGFGLHFGLADADEIESLTVDWPDGTSLSVPPPALGTVIRIDHATGGVEVVGP